MKKGDLVRVNSQIDELVAELGAITGIIIEVSIAQSKQTVPMLTDVLWSNGDIESLYTDELELINVNS